MNQFLLKSEVEIRWMLDYNYIKNHICESRVMPSDYNYHPRFPQSEVDFVPRCCVKCPVN